MAFSYFLYVKVKMESYVLKEHGKIVKQLDFGEEIMVTGARLRCAAYDLGTTVEWVVIGRLFAVSVSLGTSIS